MKVLKKSPGGPTRAHQDGWFCSRESIFSISLCCDELTNNFHLTPLCKKAKNLPENWGGGSRPDYCTETQQRSPRHSRRHVSRRQGLLTPACTLPLHCGRRPCGAGSVPGALECQPSRKAEHHVPCPGCRRRGAWAGERGGLQGWPLPHGPPLLPPGPARRGGPPAMCTAWSSAGRRGAGVEQAGEEARGAPPASGGAGVGKGRIPGRQPGPALRAGASRGHFPLSRTAGTPTAGEGAGRGTL